MLRLTGQTSVTLEGRGEARLRVCSSGETLLLRDDGSAAERLHAWETALSAHVRDIAAEQLSGVGGSAEDGAGGVGGAGAVGSHSSTAGGVGSSSAGGGGGGVDGSAASGSMTLS